MYSEGDFQSDATWLQVWRTPSDCTSGGFGVFCALEPLLFTIQSTREASVTRVYGGGGRRASRLLHLKGSQAGGGALLDYSRLSRAMDSTVQTPSFGVSGSAQESLTASECCNGGALVPPISGFMAFAIPSVSRSEESGDHQEFGTLGNKPLEDETIPVAPETARPSHNMTDSIGHSVPMGIREESEETEGRVVTTDNVSSDASRSSSNNSTGDNNKNDKNKNYDESMTSAKEKILGEEEEDEEDGIRSEDNFTEGGHLVCVPGDVLYNRYALVRQLGRGRSSRVWLAVDLDQCSIARRQLLRALGEQEARKYLASQGQPLFVAIKVFRCGVVYEECAQYEETILTYINECVHVQQLQEALSVCSSDASPGVSPQRQRYKADSMHVTPERMMRQLQGSCRHRIGSMRGYFTHQGAFGCHHCIVLDVMGASVDVVINETQLCGLPESVACSITRSAMGGLASLASMHIVHTDIKPENLLFVDLEEAVLDDMVTFQTQRLGMVAPVGLGCRGSRSRVSLESTPTCANGEFSIPRASREVDIVSTPPSSQQSCGYSITPHLLFTENDSNTDAADFVDETTYAVEVSDFGLSFLIPPHMRLRGEHNGASERVREEILMDIDEDDWKDGDEGFTLNEPLFTLNSPLPDTIQTSMTNLSQGFPISTDMLFPSFLAASTVMDLEREILSRQTYRRGFILQSREYRSPEIILGQDFDTSIDIWSMGCVAFELVVGRFLFDPSTDFADALDSYEKAEELRKSRTRGVTTRLKESFLGSLASYCNNEERGNCRDNNEYDPKGTTNPEYFVDREKSIDAWHLRRMILLLGAPPPEFVLSTPKGEYIHDFFDREGRFMFLGEKECSDVCGLAEGNCTKHRRRSSYEEVSLSESQRSNSSCIHANCGGSAAVTAGWKAIREQINDRIGNEHGSIFDDFLRKCLQWDPSQRHCASDLLNHPWLTELTSR